jgi:hypothetical protein
MGVAKLREKVKEQQQKVEKTVRERLEKNQEYFKKNVKEMTDNVRQQHGWSCNTVHKGACKGPISLVVLKAHWGCVEDDNLERSKQPSF